MLTMGSLQNYVSVTTRAGMVGFCPHLIVFYRNWDLAVLIAYLIIIGYSSGLGLFPESMLNPKCVHTLD